MAHRRNPGAPRPADNSPQTYTCVRCPCSNGCRAASSADTAGQDMKGHNGHYVCTKNNACSCPSPARRAPYNAAFSCPPRYACYTYICNGGNCTLQKPAGGAAEPEAPPDELEPEEAMSDTYIRTVYETADEKPSADLQDPEDPESPTKSDSQPANSETDAAASDSKAGEPPTYTTHLYVEANEPSSATDLSNPAPPPNNSDSTLEALHGTPDAASSDPVVVVHTAPAISDSSVTASEPHIVITVEPESHSTKQGRFSVHAFPGKSGASKKGKNAKKGQDQVPSDQETSVSRSPGHKLKPAKKKTATPRKVKKLKKNQYPL